MHRSQAYSSNWILALLLCFGLQSMLPTGYMLGSNQSSWVTLCTSDGLSTRLLDVLGESNDSQHSSETAPCLLSALDAGLAETEFGSITYISTNIDTPRFASSRSANTFRLYAPRAPPLA